MKWSHMVNPEWLSARKNYLTAGDIMKLLPVTPTGRPRANMDEIRLKVWADKQCVISEEDIMSSGAMGRGHLLEPYAIQEFNKTHPHDLLYHWDDMLIHSANGVACSPDALDIPLPTGAVSPVLAKADARIVGEIKSYNGAAHYAAGFSSPGDLEERWQLAVAMYVMPTIEIGYLIFFNPGAKHKLFVHSYDRNVMMPELAMIDEIKADYDRREFAFDVDAETRCVATDDCVCEADIIAELLAEQESSLNP